MLHKFDLLLSLHLFFKLIRLLIMESLVRNYCIFILPGFLLPFKVGAMKHEQCMSNQIWRFRFKTNKHCVILRNSYKHFFWDPQSFNLIYSESSFFRVFYCFSSFDQLGCLMFWNNHFLPFPPPFMVQKGGGYLSMYTIYILYSLVRVFFSFKKRL